MNYAQNPYAPPQAPPPHIHDSRAVGPQQPWSPGEVIGMAWERLKSDWPVLIFSWFVVFVIVEGLALIPTVLQLTHSVEGAAFLGVQLVSSIVQLSVTMFFQVGLMRIWLESARGGSPSFALLFSGFDRLFPLLGCALLQGLAVVLGTLCFIAPGVLLGLGLSLSQLYVVDAKMGPIAAMTESWKATKGQMGNIFVLGLAFIGLCFAGLMMCGVGMFVMIPLGYTAFAIAFVRMSGRGTTQDYAPPPAPFPGGYQPTGF
jgi:uncharacterized membrane protein